MNDQHVNLIQEGAEAWNSWRNRNPSEKPDLRGLQLSKADFTSMNLVDADFRRAILREPLFIGCDLTSANFADADLAGANFRGAELDEADFSDANLSRTNFFQASCLRTTFRRSNLYTANFREMVIAETILADVDLATVIGLDQVIHRGASSVSVDTLYRSAGNISRPFLHGVGFPDVMLDYIPSLIQAGSTVQFHSCFVSYSQDDEVFARNLWGRMKKERISVWYAPEDMQGGQKLFEQIDRAIQMQDKLVVVLSKASMKSEWVQTEIRRARRYEGETKDRKLFPISIVDFDAIRQWECLDADTGRDIAVEVREYFIPDFSHWREPARFEEAFQKLRNDLRKAGVRGLEARG